MFNSFLNSLKRPGNEPLIESIQKAHKTCFESFYTSSKVKPKYGNESFVEVFINPTPNEINDLMKKHEYIRLAYAYDRNLYAWRGDVTHHAVDEKFDIDMMYGWHHADIRPTLIATDWSMGPAEFNPDVKIAITKIKHAFPNVELLMFDTNEYINIKSMTLTSDKDRKRNNV